MVITLTCSLGLTFFVIQATRRSWDYVATTLLFHFVLCCIGKWTVGCVAGWS